MILSDDAEKMLDNLLVSYYLITETQTLNEYKNSYIFKMSCSQIWICVRIIWGTPKKKMDEAHH